MVNPIIDYENHPIFKPKHLILETPAMKQLGEVLQRWLWTGATGGLIYGTSRVGKSVAIQQLVSNLKTRSKVAIPSYYFSIPRRDKYTISSVFRNLCYSANLKVANGDTADHLSDRYTHYIADKAYEKKCDHAILIVDEMQRLHLPQFDAFAELYDKLLLLDISFMVVFVGNDPESWRLIEQIEEPRYAHIRGRFFTQGTSFLGLTSEKQVAVCLSQYDTLCYPKDGPSYVAYFLPDAVENGWCFASLSSDFWRIFREYQRKYKIKSWGMKHFTVTTNTLLSDFLPRYGVESFNDEMMHECVHLSGLLPSLVRPA